MSETPLIAGSWEDLLQRAAVLAGQGDAAAVPLYEKIIERLGRMQDAQLDAGDGYLRHLRDQAAFGLNLYYFGQERFEEALAVARRALEWVRGEPEGGERQMWRRRATSLLLLLERGDEAEAEALRWAEESADPDEWGSLATLQMRRGRYDAAATTIDRMEKAAGQQADPQQAAEQRAFVARLRSTLALKQGRWAEAVAWHTSAVAFDPDEAEAVSFVYSELVRVGRPQEALPLIAGDKARPIRAHLWRGLALRAQGKPDGAWRAWESAAGVRFEDVPGEQRMDWVLSTYFIGDIKRRGQAAALAWADSREPTAFLGLFLAGLGAALHGDMDVARTDMRHAAQGWQMIGETPRIPHTMRYFAEQLLDEAQMAELRPYFEDNPS